MLAMTQLVGFGAGGDGGNDQYTKILLHFDGADASTTITDSNVGGSAHTWTAGGNAQIDTAISKFGGAALLCDGSGDYVSTPDSADFTLGSGDWTVDCWFNYAGSSGARSIMFAQCNSSATTSTISVWLEHTTGNKMELFVASGVSAFVIDTTTSITSAGWHHIAAVRTGNVLKLFLDGTQEGGDKAIAVSVNDSANQFRVGMAGEFTTSPWNGSIDEFRLSVGIARWTANFTPPTDQYLV